MTVEIKDLDEAFGGQPMAPEAPRGLSVADLDAAFPQSAQPTSFAGRAFQAFKSAVAPVETALQAATPETFAQAQPVLPAPPSQAEVTGTPPGVPTALPEAPTIQPPVQEPLPIAGVEGGQPDLSVLTTPTPVGQPLVTGAKAGFHAAAEGSRNVLEGLSKLTGLQAQPEGQHALSRNLLAARQVLIEGLLNIGMAPFMGMGAGAREAFREAAPEFEAVPFATGGTAAFLREMLGAGPVERTPEAQAALQQPMTTGEALEIATTLAIPFLAHKAAARPRPAEVPKPPGAPPAPLGEPPAAAVPQLPKREVQITASLPQVEVPMPPGRPQEAPVAVEAALQRAQEASQRAGAAIGKIEELPKRAAALPEGPPREVPPEILPAGRIAEAAPPTEPVVPKEPIISATEIQPPPDLKPYAESLVASGRVHSVTLVGSLAERGQGRDVDLLYDFGAVGLPKHPQAAANRIERLIESTRGIDLDRYDSFIRADDRYFHVSSGAGREVIENTDYGREQANRPRIVLAEAGKATEIAPRAEATPTPVLPPEVPPEAKPATQAAGLEPVPAIPTPEIAPDFGTQNVLFTRERAEAARQRIQEKAGGTTFTTGIDPTLLKDYLDVGGYYVEGGVREFAQWADRMAKDFGETIRPHLQSLWDEINRKDVAPPFFSPLQRQIEAKMPERALPIQVVGILKSAGLPEDAVKWSGVEDWLRGLPAGQKVTKGDLVTFLRENDVRVEEVEKGEGTRAPASWREVSPGFVWTSEPSGYVIEHLQNNKFLGRSQGSGLQVLGDTFEETAGKLEEFRRNARQDFAPTKFSRYTLPGGQQYRELLLRWNPARPEPTPDILDFARQLASRSGEDWAQLGPNGRQRFINEAQHTSLPGVYRSPHFDEPNVLAHVRFDDRVDAQGKKVLFIEELQSDWHQAGRRRGYQPQIPANRLPEGYRTERSSEPGRIASYRVVDPQGQTVAEGSSPDAAIGVFLNYLNRGEVPSAPFAKTWHELVLKRMLRWAAERGYDRVAWTTGEQQAERYDLSKQVKSISYFKHPEREAYDLSARTNDNRLVDLATRAEPQELNRYVGKDLANKILRGEGQQKGLPGATSGVWREFTGLDLKIGGESLKAFYDQIVPQFLNQYGKKWGARVGSTEIRATGEAVGPPEARRLGRANVPAIDITPAMRRSVLTEGQPLFGAAREGIPPVRPSEPLPQPLPEVPAGVAAPESPQFGMTNKVFTADRRDAASARLREKLGGGTLRAGIDPTVLKDLAEVGGFYLEGGLREFGGWSERMIRDFGEAIRPYLQPVWDDIQKTRGVEGREPGGTAIISVEPPKAERAGPPDILPGGLMPEGPPPLTEPVLQLGRHKEVVDAAETLFREAEIARDKDRFPILSDQILEELKEGRLQLPVMQRALEAHNLSLADFGEQLFRPAIKNAAQRLQMLSVLQRRLNDLANQAGTREEAKALTDMAEQAELLRRETDESLKAMSWWRRADNIRRGLLVTQFATAVRNAETQVGRVGLDVLDQAVQKAFGGQGADPWKALETLSDNLSQLRPTPGGAALRKVSQAKIDAFLEAFPKEHDRLFGSYSSDIAQQANKQGTVLTGADKAFTAAEKVVNLLNVFNRFQEFATRRAVFWGEMEGRLERKGIDAETLVKGEQKLTPQEWEGIEPEVKASVQKALEITFAQNPAYGTIGWHFVKMVNQLPIILSGPIPFPRFMTNSLKFLYEFSPLGFMKLMTPAERAKWTAGDRQTISRASLGTAMTVAAWLSREGQPDDNKWYEYTVPGGPTVDIRPFNPFAAYAFVGEVAKRARAGTLYKIESADIIRGIASANVRGGLGLFALDKMVQGLGELSKTGKLMDALKSAGGELLSGLLVPLRTLTDLYAQFDPELQIVRERRSEPLTGPAVSQFGVGEPQYLPTRAEPQKREQPALRQLTGTMVVSEKNDLERELDRFQFDRREIQGPATGDPAADNLIAKHMGRLAEQSLVPFVASMEYQRRSDPERMDVLRKRLTMIRAQAKAFAQREEPEMFRMIKEERVPARERLLKKEREERGLIPARP